MRSTDVLDILGRLESAEIPFWVDGGWGVDALLGTESRDHSDLDLVVWRNDLGRVEMELAHLGYVHATEVQPGLPTRLVLRSNGGKQVDLHPVVIDEAGNGWQELDGNAWGLYPADGMRGSGTIAGRPVPCLTPDLQLQHHLGYPWREVDRGDMRRLARRFDLRLPPGFVPDA